MTYDPVFVLRMIQDPFYVENLNSRPFKMLCDNSAL